jgi:hypothetical protein
MDSPAHEWLAGLAARGITVTMRKNRLSLHPADAYKSLTADELLTLRDCRPAIKAAVKAGTTVTTRPIGWPREDAIDDETAVEKSPCTQAAVPPPPPQPIDRNDWRWRIIHANDPEEIERRKRETTDVMFTMVGRTSTYL